MLERHKFVLRKPSLFYVVDIAIDTEGIRIAESVHMVARYILRKSSNQMTQLIAWGGVSFGEGVWTTSVIESGVKQAFIKSSESFSKLLQAFITRRSSEAADVIQDEVDSNDRSSAKLPERPPRHNVPPSHMKHVDSDKSSVRSSNSLRSPSKLTARFRLASAAIADDVGSVTSSIDTQTVRFGLNPSNDMFIMASYWHELPCIRDSRLGPLTLGDIHTYANRASDTHDYKVMEAIIYVLIMDCMDREVST